MILEGIISIILLILSYWFYCFNYYYKHLKCVPSPKCWPIVGSALHFGKIEEQQGIIKTMMKDLNSKTIRLHLGFRARLLTADYKLVEFLLSSQTILDKGEEYDLFWGFVGQGILTSPGNLWRKQRKIISPTFHFEILQQFIEVFNSNGVILINKLKKRIGSPSVDVFPLLSLYTLDIICETAMGASVNAQLEETSEYLKSVSTVNRIISQRLWNPLYHRDFIYKLSGLYQEEKAALKVIHGYTESVLQRKRQHLQNKECAVVGSDTDNLGRRVKVPFLDMLLKSTIDAKPLTDDEIRNEVSTILFGGHDTTAAALSYALFSLANNPDVQQKAFEEVHNIFGNDNHRPCTYSDIQEMKYLELVIKETLRMYPPVSRISRKGLKEITYDGVTIPKMMSICIEVHAIHHDPDNFPEPEKFDPERFAPENYDRKRPFCYIPFSAGPRNCIGQKFALIEMKTTLSTILRQFELKPATPKYTLKLAPLIVLKSLNGIRISFCERINCQ